MREAALSGRLHHAWLIGGPQGIGKATLAFRFARALLAGFPGDGLHVPETHPVFRRVANGTHADLASLSRSWDDKRKRVRNEIVADEVRAIGDFMALTPAEGGWRVVVVDGAEHLNRAAANALLKLLEEPPSRALMLLVSASPGRLLPTVRSRCRQLRLGKLAEPDVGAIVSARRPDLDPEIAAALARRGAGSPGRALADLPEDAEAIEEAVEAALHRREAAPDAQPGAADIALADGLGRTEDAFGAFTDRLRAALEERARRLAASDLARANLAAEASLAVGALREQTTRFNLDRRQAILAALQTVRT